MVHTKEELGLSGGVLVTNPIPEEYSLEPDYINGIIDEAIEESKRRGIHGKDVTPFLLANIVKRTEGKSLEANLELVYNNARVGARIAAAYASIK